MGKIFYVESQIITAQPLHDYRVLLCQKKGQQRVFDVKPFMDKGIFRELRDQRMFGCVRVNFGTVEWPIGADFCPESLYSGSVSRS